MSLSTLSEALSPRHRDGRSAITPRCEHTLFAVECPVCTSYTEKSLAWLRDAQALPCGSCGAEIDVASGQNRALIEMFVNLDAGVGG